MKKILTCFLAIVGISMAGQNSSAKLFIDTDITTPVIDTVKQVAKDSNFTVGLNISDVIEMYSFQVYIQYDTSRIQFVSAVKGNANCTNFLESKGGSPFFTGKKSLNDSTRILLAGSLLGGDQSQCVSGSGIVALVTFKLKVADSAKLTLTNSIILDYSEKVDSALQKYSAKIIGGQSRIVFGKVTENKIHGINQVNGKICITLPDASKSEIMLFDAKGRLVIKRNEQSRQLYLNLPNTGTGFFIIKIAQKDMIRSYPLIMK